jgi:hypothetical protein
VRGFRLFRYPFRMLRRFKAKGKWVSFRAKKKKKSRLRRRLREKREILMQASTVGERPKDPSKISFDRRCFRRVGTRKEYVIGFLAPKYPEVFDNEDDAKRRAKQVGRSYRVRRVAVMKRISWR